MFKSKEHEVGFNNLRKDYEDLVVFMAGDRTRLTEKTMETLEQSLQDEIIGCFDEETQERLEYWFQSGQFMDYLDGYDFLSWAKTIPHYLIEAYKGTYEDRWDDANTGDTGKGEPHEEWVWRKIHESTPREHLKVYLEWNGIIGWQSQIEFILDGFK